MTRRQLAHLLEQKHQRSSWRVIARDMGGRVPAGTLARICKSGGKYIPKKWLAYFGISQRVSSKTKLFTRLADLPAREIKKMFENRMEM